MRKSVWVFYLLGFSLTLLYKWARYVRVGKGMGKSVWHSTVEWFMEPSVSNIASWTGTIAGVWLIGSIYIDRIVNLAVLNGLPLDRSIGFFLGTIFEYTVPNLTKWIADKIPF